MTTELTGLALREAVARALGEPLCSDSECTRFGPHRHSPGGTTYILNLPLYESSLDACFAPGGPVERLKEDGWYFQMNHTIDAKRYMAFFTRPSAPARDVNAANEVPAEAVCRAFLKAVEGTP